MIIIKHFQLLGISKKPSVEVKRLRILIPEIFKTLNDSNPVFMKDIVYYCQNKSHKMLNLHVHSFNTYPAYPRCSHLKFFTRKYNMHRFSSRA